MEKKAAQCVMNVFTILSSVSASVEVSVLGLPSAILGTQRNLKD